MNLSYESALNFSRQICSQTQTTESKIKTEFSVDLLGKIQTTRLLKAEFCGFIRQNTNNETTKNGILWILLCKLFACFLTKTQNDKNSLSY